MRILGGLVLVGAVLAGCGGDDGDPVAAERSTTTTAEPTTTTAEVTTSTTSKATTTTVSAAPCADEEPTKVNTGGWVLICKEDFGEEWPFTVADGLLSCRTLETLETGGGPAIVFGPDDTAYAINGAAKAVAAENEWKAVDDIWLDDSASPGLKISLQPIIAAGLDLCP